mmetsp:Transcript_18634/g.35444  ORF Transcript_18634/g.35444 Transcript_18634/m.35444 type:complete len:1067 (-) Transcript_18634:77-3277(-)
MVAFDRPVGAPADTAELNYVCALHQTTCDNSRPSASISAVDIQCFLTSRYGLQVSIDVITRVILQSLAWTPSTINTSNNTTKAIDEHQQGVIVEDETEQMDQMELLTILLIPYLCKAQRMATGRPLPQHVREPAASVLPMVCQIIQDDVHFLQEGGSGGAHRNQSKHKHGAPPPRLTAAWIQSVLRAYGEEDLAADDDLVTAMLQLVSGAGSTQVRARHEYFTPRAFGQALTADVLHKYDPADETRYSTAWQDAVDALTLREHFQSLTSSQSHNNNSIDLHCNPQQLDVTVLDTTARSEDEELSSPLPNNSNNNNVSFRRVFTAPSIDLTTETYRSKSLLVVLFIGVMLNYIAYIASTGVRAYDAMYCDELIRGDSWISNAGALACATGNSVLWWSLTFLGLSVYGIILGGLGSLGNSPDNTRPFLPLAGAVFAFLAILLPIVSAETKDEGTLATGPRFLRILAIFPLLYVLVMHLLHFTSSSMDSQCEATLILQPLQDEQNLKSATHFKINRLVDNALAIHDSTDAASEQIVMSRFGHALHAFSKFHETERVGGFFWTWEQIWDGSINRQEGVWYSARFLAANVAQYVVALGVLVGGSLLTQASRDGLDLDTVAKWLYQVLDSVLVAEEGEDTTGLTCSQISSKDASEFLTDVCPSWPECNTNRNVELLCGLLDMKMLAEALLPSEEYMLTVPVALGAIAAFLTAFLLALSYLPSVTSTTLKLRSGVLPTLNSSKIITYKKDQVMVTLLFGSIFWSCMVASALVGFIIFCILFFFLYERTSFYAQKFFVIIIGALLAVLFRTLIMNLGRQKYFQAFYRTRPASANLYFLALEWANFALTVAFALIRFTKLLAVATLSVGRIDTHILSEDVTFLGPIDMDNAPTMHTRDILIHEAHRHPYIEALGSFYLTKLRYGNKYCTRAGSTWRLIFVYALMPWMQKHRIAGQLEDNKQDVEGGDSSVSVSTFSKARPSRLVAQTNDDLHDENERLRKELTRLRVLMTARHGKNTAETDSLSMYFNDAQKRMALKQNEKDKDDRSRDSKKKKKKVKKDPSPSNNTSGMPAISE